MNSTSIDKKALTLLTERTKCMHCKHRFDKPYLLPIEKPNPGTFSPNVNVDVLAHVADTHGIQPDIYIEWIIGKVYGQELSLTGIKSGQPLAVAFS